jgi:hypothetical protein
MLDAKHYGTLCYKDTEHLLHNLSNPEHEDTTLYRNVWMQTASEAATAIIKTARQ